MDRRTAHVASIISLFVLYLVCVHVTTAAPLSDELSTTKRKLIERNADKKTVDVEQIRHLLNQRLQKTEGIKRRSRPNYHGPSSFDDEDPLHILLGNAASRPTYYNRRDRTTKINRNVAVADVKRINADAATVKDQLEKRFMDAIGLGSYPMGSSSSNDNWFIGREPYDSSSSSNYGYNNDDSDDDYDYGSTDY